MSITFEKARSVLEEHFGPGVTVETYGREMSGLWLPIVTYPGDDYPLGSVPAVRKDNGTVVSFPTNPESVQELIQAIRVGDWPPEDE